MSDSFDDEDSLVTTYPNRGDATLLGASEPDSPWTNFSGLLKTATNAVTGVGSALNAFDKPKQPENVKANDPNYKGGANGFSLFGIQGYGVIAIGLVLVVAAFFFIRKR